MERKKIRKSRYLAAFLLTIVIFLIGFIVGSVINELKLQRVYDLQNDIRIESLGNELLFELISSDLCTNINTTAYTQELADLGKKLTYMESIYGPNQPQVLSIKNYYTLLLIRHYLITLEGERQCGIDVPSVLYFYTNTGCEDCEDQGLVLTNVHRNYPFFNTYSFEYALDNPSLNFLKERYNIESQRLPTLVINDEVHYGFQSKDFLIDYLELERRLAEDKEAHPEWYD